MDVIALLKLVVLLMFCLHVSFLLISWVKPTDSAVIGVENALVNYRKFVATIFAGKLGDGHPEIADIVIIALCVLAYFLFK